jgi:hypothetical protein
MNDKPLEIALKRVMVKNNIVQILMPLGITAVYPSLTEEQWIELLDAMELRFFELWKIKVADSAATLNSRHTMKMAARHLLQETRDLYALPLIPRQGRPFMTMKFNRLVHPDNKDVAIEITIHGFSAETPEHVLMSLATFSVKRTVYQLP